MTLSSGRPEDVLRRLEAAAGRHDLDALVQCFAANYVNETPVHPARGFSGREQVRANWRQIFAGVPDLRARILRYAVQGNEVWSEWEMSGTRRDGQPHLMRGVVIFEITQDTVSSARFFLEPVDDSSSGVDEAVRALMGAIR